MTATRDELRWMRRALALARRGQGQTGHYPMVGAVVVKNGRVVGEGWFRRPGEPHAEVHALQQAGRAARGATLILNLEPCSHFGRTPPCADAVIAAGVRRVVAGMTDPNPLVAGAGFRKLEAAGIEVVADALEAECREFNRVFVKFIVHRVPYVLLKAAATLDGKIAAASGDSRWVTGEAARQEVHRLRGRCQAVMVGAGTVRKDDCRLTVRAGKGRQPRPVVVTTALEIPLSARVLKTPAAGGPLLFCTRAAGRPRVETLRAAGAEVVVVKKDRQGRADLQAVMAELGKRRIASVMVEGGSGLFGSFIRERLVDEVALFLAPKLLGGGISITGDEGPRRLADALALGPLQVRRIGADVMLVARVLAKVSELNT
jgi:diaminohydroxyphosphoribosylaminopyrimidine deaminase/5-amino-6-(5-phosphoribosylamino)uracil reductase